ncbi:J domain-containing protein [Prochlorothrix hollandica]|uniref:J domain-containing protein n=1 Tax=Prochlorothrix hollandica PCC 9006 = CALU 1027 TaxID=317619 RepID=A0A0M2PUA8_PROHO|nr:DnaJ domain-containing protein [Prochlorothrix hollandica]KKI98697.1 hypothetical protein PROH_17795 [Prochlorothrix hollandica PCC 9006 = CALU 1027]
MDIQEAYDRLGVDPEATPAALKTAYHKKLREFPPQKYPEEFKVIRQAYDLLKNPVKSLNFPNFWDPDAYKTLPDPALVQRVRLQVEQGQEATLADLIKLSF